MRMDCAVKTARTRLYSRAKIERTRRSLYALRERFAGAATAGIDGSRRQVNSPIKR